MLAVQGFNSRLEIMPQTKAQLEDREVLGGTGNTLKGAFNQVNRMCSSLLWPRGIPLSRPTGAPLGGTALEKLKF